LFPNLEFISRVRSQIEGFRAGQREFDNAYQKLWGLEKAIERWKATNDVTPNYGFYVRGESPSRINEGHVDFRDDDGVSRTFSDHADFGPSENRLHFIVLHDPQRRCLIGHVGRKIGIG